LKTCPEGSTQLQRIDHLRRDGHAHQVRQRVGLHAFHDARAIQIVALVARTVGGTVAERLLHAVQQQLFVVGLLDKVMGTCLCEVLPGEVETTRQFWMYYSEDLRKLKRITLVAEYLRACAELNRPLLIAAACRSSPVVHAHT
jgi:hypothetical protein